VCVGFCDEDTRGGPGGLGGNCWIPLSSILLSLQKDVRKFHAQALSCPHTDTLKLHNIRHAVCHLLLSMAATLQQVLPHPPVAAKRHPFSRADAATSWRSTPPPSSPYPHPQCPPRLADEKRRLPPVSAPPSKRDQRSHTLRSLARLGGYIPSFLERSTWPPLITEDPLASVRRSIRLTARRTRTVLAPPWHHTAIPYDKFPWPKKYPSPSHTSACAPFLPTDSTAADNGPTAAPHAASAANLTSLESMPPTPTFPSVPVVPPRCNAAATHADSPDTTGETALAEGFSPHTAPFPPKAHEVVFRGTPGSPGGTGDTSVFTDMRSEQRVAPPSTSPSKKRNLPQDPTASPKRLPTTYSTPSSPFSTGFLGEPDNAAPLHPVYPFAVTG